MSKRKDIMKPVLVKNEGIMPFSDFSQSVRINHGFAAIKEKKEEKKSAEKHPPVPRSELIRRGLIKK